MENPGWGTDKWQFITGVVAIIVGVVVELLNGKSLQQSIFESASLGLLFFIFADKMITIEKVRRNSREINDHFGNLEKLIYGKRDVILLGKSSDTLERIAESIINAKIVWNVYSSFGSDFRRYNDKQQQLVVDTITAFLKKDDCCWLDVVTNIEEVADRMEKVFANKGTKQEKYSCFRLKVEFPVMNFVVTEFDSNRDKEVFFGFGRHPHDNENRVFFSNDPEIVNLFEKWHDTLRDERHSLSVKEDMPAFLKKRKGGFKFRSEHPQAGPTV